MKILALIFVLLLGHTVLARDLNSSILNNSNVAFINDRELPKQVNRRNLCDLCIYKLYPAQAQVKLSCDGKMLIDYKAVSIPRESADTFAAKLMTLLFLKMNNLGFDIVSSFRNGDCNRYLSRSADQQPIDSQTANNKTKEPIIYNRQKASSTTAVPDLSLSCIPEDGPNKVPILGFDVDFNWDNNSYKAYNVNTAFASGVVGRHINHQKASKINYLYDAYQRFLVFRFNIDPDFGGVMVDITGEEGESYSAKVAVTTDAEEYLTVKYTCSVIPQKN